MKKPDKTLNEALLELEKARNEFIKSVLKGVRDYNNRLVELSFGVPARWIKNHWKKK